MVWTDAESPQVGCIQGTDTRSPNALNRWVATLPYGLRTVSRKGLGLDRLEALRREAAGTAGSTSFLGALADALRVTCEVGSGSLDQVPKSGPVVVVSNHPHGILDGVVLGAVLGRIRSDVKIVANSRLAAIPELGESLIAVDPYGGRDSERRNRRPLREALDWLNRGGLLVIFPAGDVARLRAGCGRVVESPWITTAARLALNVGASVVPVHLSGRNTWAYQLLGLLHRHVRTAMLPRELLKKRNATVRIVFGQPIRPEQCRFAREVESLTRYMKLRAVQLGQSHGGSPGVERGRGVHDRKGLEPIAPPEDAVELRREIQGLTDDELVRGGSLRVFCFRSRQAPRLLREIGRIREITFRGVGEGSGLSRDLDEFDDHYLHVVLWDDDRELVAGAYRMGLTDEILAGFGVAGLYTRTLFRYGRPLLHELGPAIELGRSFVVAEHQRSYGALLLLWKGIVLFARRHPRYRVMFGAVSISAEYDSMTKRLLVAFLQSNFLDERRAGLVRARRPPRFGRSDRADIEALSAVAGSVDDADELVRHLDRDGRGIPVLVRQYLQLNARLLGFNIDPKFGNVLDGLFYVDLARVDRRTLGRYMGVKELDEFLSSPSRPVPLT